MKVERETRKVVTGPGPFEKVSINGMTLANHFVRSATREGLASQEHAVTPKLTEMMVELARGEVGLIISGYTFVSPEGQSGPGQLGVYDDRFLPAPGHGQGGALGWREDSSPASPWGM